MKIPRSHRWDVSYAEARAIQESLRGKLIFKAPAKATKFIAGTDVSYEKHGDLFFAGVVVWDIKSGEVVERKGSRGCVKFPYIPGLLSFREAPVLLDAFQKIESKIDVVICDGQGIAHPRGFGLAAHVSYLLDLPGVGAAKTRLIGEHEEVGRKRGERSDLLIEGKKVGVALRTKDNVKPVYVSPGHKMTIDAAAELVLRCCTKYRLPEPTRLAHIFVNSLRKAEL